MHVYFTTHAKAAGNTLVMSGLRLLGSSAVFSLYTIVTSGLTTSCTIFASSSMVNSVGLPMLKGPVSGPSITVTIPARRTRRLAKVFKIKTKQ